MRSKLSALPATSRLPPELLDAWQTGDLLGCSARTVRRMSSNGELPKPIRVASLVRWRRSEIQAWIERSR
jgi:excisionase family DNA binding protein